MRGELFEPGGCSAWPTSAWAIATMRAAAELPPGAAAGATALAAPVVAGAGPAVAPAGVATEAVRSICAKLSLDGAAVVVVVVAGAAGAGAGAAVGPTRSVFSCVMRGRAVSRLICSLHRKRARVAYPLRAGINGGGRPEGRPPSSIGSLPLGTRDLS